MQATPRVPTDDHSAGHSALGAVLRALKVTIVLGLVGAMGWGGYWLYETYDVPVAVIGVEGEISQVETGEVERIVAGNLGGGFLSLDLDGICRALEEHPWVASASARRKWPDEVVIAIEEEVPIARWSDNRFLNNKGKVLDIAGVSLSLSLPLLDGPAGQERRVMQQYRNFSQVLQPMGLKVETARLAPRGNWVVAFDSGLRLVIGKEPVAGKLQRLLLVWDKQLKDRAENIEQVDIRYGNGVAVRWKEQSELALHQERYTLN